MKKIIWTDEMTGMLTELFPSQSNAGIAAVLGIGTSQVAVKAAVLGLKKEREIRREGAVSTILNNFTRHSYSELSRMAGVSVRTVIRVAARHGLRHSDSEYRGFISARRLEIIKRERLRLRLGLPPMTKIRVTADRRRVHLRNRLRQSGYIVERGGDTVYFTPDVVRNMKREETGASLGLTFMPLPPRDPSTYLRFAATNED